MKKCKITVYDYRDRNNVHKYERDPEKICKYEVDAWCVDGEEGIMAFFTIDDMFYIANGDDGHWWVVSQCHKHWVKDIAEAMSAVALD